MDMKQKNKAEADGFQSGKEGKIRILLQKKVNRTTMNVNSGHVMSENVDPPKVSASKPASVASIALEKDDKD